MWHDTETTKDLLNFSVIADIAAQIVRESGEEPLSIGVSGGWGTGKSSLVKMIGASLAKKDASDNKKYLLLEFNAWLYQGYDDARVAMLQAVADRLYGEAEKRQTCIDRATDFAKRINWLRVVKLFGPSISGAVLGGTLGGPIGAVIGAASGLCKAASPSQEDLEKLKKACAEFEPELAALLRERGSKSLPQEIAELRSVFADLLKSLDVTLVVLVDDLDRCLPPTAISTLEAMRSLLFVPRTAFIIAADEQMIRGAVRTHFGDVDLGDELVTSYFDKLIQVPLQVPRLGTTEVKAYLVLLLAERAVRKGTLSETALASAEATILDAIRQSWAGTLTRRKLEEAFGDRAAELNKEIDLADQLASLMVSADRIVGNPRLIKRFLNNLEIRESVAKAENITISFDQLVKLQLFERCASPAAFEFLVKQVANSENGKPKFLGDIEARLEQGKEWKSPDVSWEGPFIARWIALSPKLGDSDLRPLLHLSRDRALSLASFDELSTEGRTLLDAILMAKSLMSPLVDRVKLLGETEAERILVRIHRLARANQWQCATLVQGLHITKAFPRLGSVYIRMLNEIPPKKRPAPLIPRLSTEEWAAGTLKRWSEDPTSPATVKKAVAMREER